MDYVEFANFLGERAKEKGLGAKRLSELTGISVKNIEAIVSGDPRRLPSPPYLKGYLSKLGEVLDFNPEEAWNEMKNLAAAKSSGKADELTKNRFAKKPANKYIVAGAVLVILVFYFGFRFYEISGTPLLKISEPAESVSTANNNYAPVSGTVSNGDGLTINGENVPIQKDGGFQKTIVLQPGINNVEIIAKKFLGRETKIIRQIIYLPAQAGLSATSTQPTINRNLGQ